MGTNYYLHCKDCGESCEESYTRDRLEKWIQNKEKIKDSLDFLQEMVYFNSVIPVHEHYNEAESLRFVWNHAKHDLEIQ